MIARISITTLVIIAAMFATFGSTSASTSINEAAYIAPDGSVIIGAMWTDHTTTREAQYVASQLDGPFFADTLDMWIIYEDHDAAYSMYGLTDGTFVAAAMVTQVGTRTSVTLVIAEDEAAFARIDPDDLAAFSLSAAMGRTPAPIPGFLPYDTDDSGFPLGTAA